MSRDYEGIRDMDAMDWVDGLLDEGIRGSRRDTAATDHEKWADGILNEAIRGSWRDRDEMDRMTEWTGWTEGMVGRM